MAPCFCQCRLTGLGVGLGVYFTLIIFLATLTLKDTRNAPKTMIVPKNIDVRQVRTGLRQIQPIGGGIIHWCSPLHYMDQTHLARGSVALASFPGSGNTWLRYLLQQATGILTGSVYNDKGLLKNGFPAEYVTNGSVLVVKTHEWGPIPRRAFSKAILLVRAPAEAIQAEFNRQSGGHVGFASLQRYKRTKGKYWQQFVSDKLRTWESVNIDWGKYFEGGVHVIFYEKLVKDVEGALRGIIHFLEIPINEELLACAITRKEGIYRRKRRNIVFDPFSKEMKIALRSRQKFVYEALGWNNSYGATLK